MIDLEYAERVINRPHIIDLREDGWTIMHQPACHPDLFACPVNLAAAPAWVEKLPQAPGRYFCQLDEDGRFVIGEPADDTQGVDWAALVAELRVARHALDLLRPARAQVRQLLDDDGLRGDLPASIRRALRQVHADLDGAVAAYDQATNR
jgi:hypothetical protein